MGVAKSSAGRSTRSSLRLRPDIDRAAEIIRQGGLVAFPTETVYGLGADASNPWAVAQVFYVKERPLSNPLIVHIADAGQLADLAQEVPPKARRLAERFWPGPLTLVLPKTSRVSDLVTAGLPHVAIRVPRHPVALRLLRTSGRAIAAPSANAFGGLSPTTAQHVREQLGKKVKVILDGGPCAQGLESTIVSFIGKAPTILRLGALTPEKIEYCIGPVKHAIQPTKAVLAPGQYPKHYAPRTPLFLEPTSREVWPSHPRVGLLCFGKRPQSDRWAHVEVLSRRGLLVEAAAELYAALHRLDHADLDAIVAEEAPPRGLGPAINDRLRRAACSPRGCLPT